MILWLELEAIGIAAVVALPPIPATEAATAGRGVEVALGMAVIAAFAAMLKAPMTSGSEESGSVSGASVLVVASGLFVYAMLPSAL